MNFALILAGGIGTRMGNIEKPKQFLKIGGKPIIVHTVEKFAICEEFQEVIVLTPNQWIEHTKNLLKKHIDVTHNITVIEGGDTRNETLMNGIKYIEENFGLDDDTIIVTHDAVRPFVTYRMIEDNINALAKCEACDTVVPATDTIVVSEDGNIISEIPNRAKLYQGQTPQSFKAKKLKELYNNLSKEEKEILTDASKIFVIRGEEVSLVAGEISNIKITYPYDMMVAESLLKGEK